MLRKGDFTLYCTNVVLFFFLYLYLLSAKLGGSETRDVFVKQQLHSLVFRSRLKCVLISRKASSRGKIRGFVKMDVLIVYTQTVVMLLGSGGL